MSEVGTALHRRAWETCRRDMMEEGSTAVGSMAVAVMAIRITTIKAAARRITEEGSTVKGEG